MALIIFKYCLPILLGYTFFVGITGRYIPFLRPEAAEKRPQWFLGLWTGLTISIMTIVGLQLAYRMNLMHLSTLIIPGIVILAASLLFGLAGFFWYRSRVRRHVLAGTNSLAQKNSPQEASADRENALAIAESTTNELDETMPVDTSGIPDVEDPKANWSGNMGSADLSGLGMDETIIFDESAPQILESNADNQTNAEAVENQRDPETESDLTVVAEALQPECEDIVDSDNEMVTLSTDSHNDGNEQDKKVILQLREELDNERKVRRELETHLRITRNGLGALEAESREFESKKAAAMIQVEKELEEKVKRTSAAETKAEREATKRAELEHEIIQLREETLKAITDSRISTEARAAALSTANKATGFARQSMKIRSRLESQLKDMKQELDRKQTTISSLIKALEKEKSRTQTDVTSMAKQLRLHEKQLQARRTLEEVSRSVDRKLSNRLVKKVAKARG